MSGTQTRLRSPCWSVTVQQEQFSLHQAEQTAGNPKSREETHFLTQYPARILLLDTFQRVPDSESKFGWFTRSVRQLRVFRRI
mmetsp:Transcript_40933/g.92301  ORF Transcript_40933/g.92301 Transcript_40933/m.92301 type:complete len:83 (+) Transcript_40933:169-417(+)